MGSTFSIHELMCYCEMIEENDPYFMFLVLENVDAKVRIFLEEFKKETEETNEFLNRNLK